MSIEVPVVVASATWVYKYCYFLVTITLSERVFSINVEKVKGKRNILECAILRLASLQLGNVIYSYDASAFIIERIYFRYCVRPGLKH